MRLEEEGHPNDGKLDRATCIWKRIGQNSFDGAVEVAAEDMATMITANAPLTVDAVKFIANQTSMDESQRDLVACDAMVQACFDSADYIEGRRAFMEKRKPVWTGG